MHTTVTAKIFKRLPGERRLITRKQPILFGRATKKKMLCFTNTCLLPKLPPELRFPRLFYLATPVLQLWWLMKEGVWNFGRKLVTGDHRRTRRENSSSVTLSTTNPKETWLELNPGHRGKVTVTAYLSHGEVQHSNNFRPCRPLTYINN